LSAENQSPASSHGRRANEHVQKLTSPEAERLTGQTENARFAGPHDCDFDPTAKPKFLDALDLLRSADNLDNFGNFPGLQTIQRNKLVHLMYLAKIGACRN